MNKKFLKKPAVVTAIVVAGIVMAVVLLTALRPKADDAKAVVKPALTVTTTVPQRMSLPISLPANGNIAAWQEASVGAEANGLRLTRVLANVGDRVQKGQVLATLGGETVQAEAAQARATLAEAEAAAAEAANNAQRARTLEGTGALSTSQINQYLTAEKTAHAKVEAARALVQQQVARVNQVDVRAPDSGIISARMATVGAVVNGGTELFRLIRQGRLEWRAEVTSTEIGRITAGTTAIVTAASGARLSGRVRTIGPTVDPQTRSAMVYVDLTPLPGTAGNALAGMFARGEFDLGAAPALTVPQAAVAVREGFSYVYRIEPDNRVTRLKVQVGRMAGDRLEIAGGVKEGERIVAGGAGFLNDGDLVRVADGAAPSPPAASAAKRQARP